MLNLRKLWPVVPPEPEHHARANAYLTRSLTCLSVALALGVVNLILVVVRVAL